MAKSPGTVSALELVHLFWDSLADVKAARLSDDSLASRYLALPASLLVFEYRGYGWSSNQFPKFSTLLSDAEACLNAVPSILGSGDGSVPPMVVYGRSMGSLCACHLARRFSDDLAGVVVESGMSAMRRLSEVRKMAQVDKKFQV